MKYPYYKIIKRRSESWVYRFNSPSSKDLVWIAKTEKEAKERIRKGKYLKRMLNQFGIIKKDGLKNEIRNSRTK